jgi:glycosyltransferase involved in cell wall biosynthesis
VTTVSQAKRQKSASSEMRVLIVSHMHPRVSRGGGEIAAYQMFEAMRDMPGIKAYFLAASGGKLVPPLGTPIFQPFTDDEFVASSEGYEYFNHSNPSSSFPKHFSELLLRLRPDVIHFHHYVNFGVEVFAHIRFLLPSIRIVVTLHEYLAICNHFGQMVKRPSLSLCEEASPRDCARCFPERSENDFFLRELFIKRFMKEVDQFISPSRFLADRYIAWGLPAERMEVIENGMKPLANPVRPMPPVENGLVLGFFGQISRLKGVPVLAKAAQQIALNPHFDCPLRIEIHGDASNQPAEIKADITSSEGGQQSFITMCGPYQNSNVHNLMQACHAVVVPSVWWENSPLVIQEAFLNRRPVICSDIGGMAEKIRNGLDGFHFRTGSSSDLAELLMNLARKPDRILNLQETLVVPPTLAKTVGMTVMLYKKLFAPTSSAVKPITGKAIAHVEHVS